VHCHYSQGHHPWRHRRRLSARLMSFLHRVVPRLSRRGIVVRVPSVLHSSSVLSHILWVQVVAPSICFPG
jgi:hypothetical protein